MISHFLLFLWKFRNFKYFSKLYCFDRIEIYCNSKPMFIIKNEGAKCLGGEQYQSHTIWLWTMCIWKMTWTWIMNIIFNRTKKCFKTPNIGMKETFLLTSLNEIVTRKKTCLGHGMFITIYMKMVNPNCPNLKNPCLMMEWKLFHI